MANANSKYIISIIEVTHYGFKSDGTVVVDAPDQRTAIKTVLATRPNHTWADISRVVG